MVKRWQKIPRPSFQWPFSLLHPHLKKFFWGGSKPKNTLYVPKERIVTLIAATGCEGPSTMVRNPTYAVLSWNQFCRELHARLGGVAKKWRMMTRGRGGSRYPPKLMTSFMNSPLGYWVLSILNTQYIPAFAAYPAYPIPPVQIFYVNHLPEFWTVMRNGTE